MSEKRKLNIHLHELCENIVNIGQVVSSLVSSGVLTSAAELDIANELSDYDKAGKLMDLIKISPNWPSAYYELVEVLTQTGNKLLGECLRLDSNTEAENSTIQVDNKKLKLCKQDFEKALAHITDDLEEIHLSDVKAKVKHLVKTFEHCSMLTKIVFHNVKLEGSFSQKMELCNLQHFEYLDEDDASGIRAVDQSGKRIILKQILFFLDDDRVCDVATLGIRLNITIGGQTYLLIDNRDPGNNINPCKEQLATAESEDKKPVKLMMTTLSRARSLDCGPSSADNYVQVDGKEMTKEILEDFLRNRPAQVGKLVFLSLVPYWKFVEWLCNSAFTNLEEISAEISVENDTDLLSPVHMLPRLPRIRVFSIYIHTDSARKLLEGNDGGRLRSLLLMDKGNPLDMNVRNVWQRDLQVHIKFSVNTKPNTIIKISPDELVLGWISQDISTDILTRIPSTVTSIYLNELDKLPVGFNQNSVKALKHFGLRYAVVGDICHLTRTCTNLTTLQLYNSTSDSLVDLASLAESSPKLQTISLHHGKIKFLERGRLAHLKNLHLYHCYPHKKELPRNLASLFPKLTKFTYDSCSPHPNIHLLAELCQHDEVTFIALWRVDWDVKAEGNNEVEILKQLTIPKEDPGVRHYERRSTNIIVTRDGDRNFEVQFKVYNDWLDLEYEQFNFDKVFDNMNEKKLPRRSIQIYTNEATGVSFPQMSKFPYDSAFQTYTSTPANQDFPLDDEQLKEITDIIQKDVNALEKWGSIMYEFLKKAEDQVAIKHLMDKRTGVSYVLETLKLWRTHTSDSTFDTCVQKFEKLDFHYICGKLRERKEAILSPK